jgi:hypothetical protein
MKGAIMSFVIIGCTAVAVGATVGVGVASIVEGQKQTDKTLAAQDETMILQGWIAKGTALESGPGAIPT